MRSQQQKETYFIFTNLSSSVEDRGIQISRILGTTQWAIIERNEFKRRFLVVTEDERAEIHREEAKSRGIRVSKRNSLPLEAL